MALTFPSFLVYCCMFWAALGKMTWKMVSILWQFCVKIGEIAQTHIVVRPKYTPCFLHSVRIKGVRDRSWQGQKWPCLSCPCVKIWRFTHSTNLGENGCFLRKWFMCNQRVEAPCHDSGKGCCIIRFDGVTMFSELLWTWCSDPVVTMFVIVFCTALFSLCRTTRVHKKIRRCSRIS